MTESQEQGRTEGTQVLDDEFIQNLADKMFPDSHYETLDDKVFALLVEVGRTMGRMYQESHGISKESAIDLATRGLIENLES